MPCRGPAKPFSRHRSSSSPGGKGGNQAVAAARAGAAVQLVAALGTDSAAEQLRAHLRDNEVGLDGVVTVPGPSGSAVIIVDAAAENTIVVAPGANAHLTVTSADVRAVIADSDVVLLQLEIPIATAVAAAGVAQAAGAVVIVNASPAGAKPHDLLALSELADVVVVNEAEAREWHWPVPHLVITRGARGASYLGEDERFDVPAPPVEAVDTTGAGDVFAGVLAAGWLARARRCVAPGLRGRRVVDTGARGGRLRALRRGDRRRGGQPKGRRKAEMTTTTPRPPEGDWLGTPYLRFTREGPFGVCTLDRPEARNAMTPAMYFGIRYAVRHVDADPDLAGLLITGTGDVFAPGGDMGGGDGSDNWLTFGSALGMDVTPFETLRQSVKPVVSAVNGLCQGGGLQIALCSDMTVVSDRATFRVPELLRGIADTYYSQMLARLIGPVRTRDLMFTGRTLTAAEAQEWGMVARVVPHDELLDDGPRGARPVLQDGTGGAQHGEVQPGQLHGPVRPHRHAGQLLLTRSDSKASARSRSADPRIGCIPDLRTDGSTLSEPARIRSLPSEKSPKYRAVRNVRPE